MIENLTTYQKIRIWLSDFSFMAKPLAWVDDVIDKTKALFSEYGVYVRYIVILFILTLLFILLRIVYRHFINWQRVSFSDISGSIRMRFWERYAQVDEKAALSDALEVFNEAKKQPNRINKNAFQPIGFDLFHQVMIALGQGLSDNEILKILPPKYSLMDAAPLIEAIRSFRDLAARKILEPKSREKRDFARALKELGEGRPHRAAQLMKRELMAQQKVLFALKDPLLQQYAKKEASKLSLELALILGVYDTRLADKAYQRAMELNPKSAKNGILYGRFRQRMFGSNDKVMGKVFSNLAKSVDKTLQNYMLNYAVEMIRRTEVRMRLDEVRSRFQDEKERFNEAVQVERLKVREALKMARIRSIAQEEKIR